MCQTASPGMCLDRFDLMWTYATPSGMFQHSFILARAYTAVPWLSTQLNPDHDSTDSSLTMYLHNSPWHYVFTAVLWCVPTLPYPVVCPHRCTLACGYTDEPWSCSYIAVPGHVSHVSTRLYPAMRIHRYILPWAYTGIFWHVPTQLYPGHVPIQLSLAMFTYSCSLASAYIAILWRWPIQVSLAIHSRPWPFVYKAGPWQYIYTGVCCVSMQLFPVVRIHRCFMLCEYKLFTAAWLHNCFLYRHVSMACLHSCSLYRLVAAVTT
jgi:hypothetical protein